MFHISVMDAAELDDLGPDAARPGAALHRRLLVDVNAELDAAAPPAAAWMPPSWTPRCIFCRGPRN